MTAYSMISSVIHIWSCSLLNDLLALYMRPECILLTDFAAFLYFWDPLFKRLLLSFSASYKNCYCNCTFISLLSCIQGDVFRSLYMYVLMNVHGWLYTMMTESERVTWWFRDFGEWGENQSFCILHSNRICGVVAFQFHFYPCDYTCPLFPLL